VRPAIETSATISPSRAAFAGMRTPCDEAILRSAKADHPCVVEARPWILAATILGSSMAFIDGTVVNVALPALQSSFNARISDLQWVVESYGLLLGALTLVGGSLGDLFGRRRMFLLGVIIFAAASAWCGLALGVRQLIIARSIQGIGAAFLVPGSLALISSSFDEKTRGQAIGTWSGFTAITAAVGPLIGGWLIEHASWRWAFFINLPMGAAVVAISLWRIPESHSTSAKRVDWLGALVVTAGLAGLVYGFIESVDLGWRDPRVFLSLIAGFACLIFFVVIEARESSPMVPLSLFKSRSFSGANLLTLLLYGALGIWMFVFPMELIQIRGYSATAAGAAMLPIILLMFTLSRWSGGLVTRYGAKLPLIIGPIIVAAGFTLFALLLSGSSYWTTFFPAALVLGFGMSVTVAPLTTTVMNSVDEDRVGTASGINNAVARVAGVLAIAVLGTLMVYAFSSHLNRGLMTLKLPPNVLNEIQANKVKLAAIKLPSDLDPGTRDDVKASISEAFLFGFRVITLICAALALGSATVTWLFIPGKAAG
jgi:EmrB/QacA subfamily drug resistance transporter